MARHAASAFRRFAFFKTKVEEKSPFLFHFSSTPHLFPPHVAPSHASFCPLRPLCPLALGQSLRTPVGHSLPIPQVHRSLLSGLWHATCPFRPPARPSPHSVALQLPTAFHRPAPHHPRCPRLAKKPPLSPPHFPAGSDRLCRHSDSVAHRP